MLSELEQICDWLIMIERGAVLYAGAAADFAVDADAALTISTGHPSDLPALQRVLTAAGHQLEVVDGCLVAHVADEDLTTAAAEVNRAAFAAGIVLTELSARRTTLQDRYLTLVDGSVA